MDPEKFFPDRKVLPYELLETYIQKLFFSYITSGTFDREKLFDRDKLLWVHRKTGGRISGTLGYVALLMNMTGAVDGAVTELGT